MFPVFFWHCGVPTVISFYLISLSPLRGALTNTCDSALVLQSLEKTFETPWDTVCSLQQSFFLVTAVDLPAVAAA